MSRELRFRAWDGETMLEPANVEDMMFSCGHNYDHLPWKGKSDNRHTDAIIMQYTGLKDKNGVDIYEGDIVECRFPDDYEYQNIAGSLIYMGAIYYNDEKTQYLMKHDGKNGCHAELGNKKPKSLTVIGNIHEHGELLEDK